MTRLINRKTLLSMIPLSERAIYDMEQRGDFPRRIALTSRNVAWDLADVESWAQDRQGWTDRKRQQENEAAEKKLMEAAAKQKDRAPKYPVKDLLLLMLTATSPKPVPGVYFLIAESGEVTYVGQSKNVLVRMSGHAERTFENVRMIRVDDSEQRLKLEAYLIKVLAPKENIMNMERSNNAPIFVGHE